jgi:hypothetical protein
MRRVVAAHGVVDVAESQCSSTRVPLPCASSEDLEVLWGLLRTCARTRSHMIKNKLRVVCLLHHDACTAALCRRLDCLRGCCLVGLDFDTCVWSSRMRSGLGFVSESDSGSSAFADSVLISNSTSCGVRPRPRELILPQWNTSASN